MTLTYGRACSRSTKRTSSFCARLIAALAAVLCCAMTTTVFTACGDDDDDKTPAELKIVAYQVDYSLEFPKETSQSTGLFGNIYLLCDKIEVGYVDENGQEQREVVNNGKWSKSVTYNKSLDGYLKLYLTKPANLDVESLPYDRYTNIVTCTPTQMLQGITAIYNNGTREKSLSTNIHISQVITQTPVAVSKLQTYFDSVSRTEVNVLSIKFDI